jgi:hypothetical protein
MELPTALLDFKDVFDYDPQKMRLNLVEVSHVIKTLRGKTLPFQPLRNLSTNELAALRDYLSTAEANR